MNVAWNFTNPSFLFQALASLQPSRTYDYYVLYCEDLIPVSQSSARLQHILSPQAYALTRVQAQREKNYVIGRHYRLGEEYIKRCWNHEECKIPGLKKLLNQSIHTNLALKRLTHHLLSILLKS